MDFVWPEDVTPYRQIQLAEVLWVLRKAPIADSSGRAVRLLAGEIARRGGRELTAGRLTGMLQQLERDPFGLIKRDLNGKRTFRIELTVDPRQSPFPPDPYKGRKAAKAKPVVKAEPVEKSMDDQRDILRQLLDDARAHEVQAQAAALPAQLVEAPMVPAVPDKHSVHDLLLFAVGAINDAIIQLASQPAMDLEAILAGRVNSIERILERNDELQRELEKSREDVRTLTKANHQLQHMLQQRSGSRR